MLDSDVCELLKRAPDRIQVPWQKRTAGAQQLFVWCFVVCERSSQKVGPHFAPQPVYAGDLTEP